MPEAASPLALGSAIAETGFSLWNAIDQWNRSKKADRIIAEERRRLKRMGKEWDQTYGRLQRQLVDQMMGRASSLALEGDHAEANIAESRLRTAAPLAAGAYQGQRDALDQSLAERGVRGGATAAGLASIARDEARTRSTMSQEALDSAREQRLDLLRQAPARPGTGVAAELDHLRNPYMIDTQGITDGAQAISLAWRNLRRGSRAAPLNQPV